MIFPTDSKVLIPPDPCSSVNAGREVQRDACGVHAALVGLPLLRPAELKTRQKSGIFLGGHLVSAKRFATNVFARA